MRGNVYVHLYDEPAAPTLRLPELAAYLRQKLPCCFVDRRRAFFQHALSSQPRESSIVVDLAKRLAAAKVRNPNIRRSSVAPLAGEVQYEVRRLSDPANRTFGLLYDGLEYMAILRDWLPREERSLSHIHIVFTNQLLGTWEPGDRRYHARVSIYGCPSIISTTGIVEAPAKPREYYFLKQQYVALGMYDAEVALKEQFRGRFLDHDDERLTEVMKGYILQAVFYQLAGEPFCADKSCRLYNAHWQEEVLHAQLRSQQELCPSHQRLLHLLCS